MRVNSVIATLGVGTILTGFAFAYSSGVPIVAGVPEAFLQLSLGRWLFGIPNNIVVMAAGPRRGLWVLVERTAIGQEIQAVGGNAAAARLAGINVDRIKTLGFVISGMCAALTGILLASRLGSGTTSAADSYLLTAFAAVFLGSATLRDGEFHVLGTLVGALIIAFGFNGLNIFGAPTFSQYMFQGVDPDRRRRPCRASAACSPKARRKPDDVRYLGSLRHRIRPLQAAAVGRPDQRHVQGRRGRPAVLLHAGAAQGEPQCAHRHRLHAGRGELRLLAQVRHPQLDLAGAHARRDSASRPRRSPTSSSPTRISTTWARSPSFPTPTSSSRRASC